MITERDITKFNPQLSEVVTKGIKFEYIRDYKETRGLFSHDKIMAFVFTFDYTNERSLNDLLKLVININQGELAKGLEDEKKTVKCFVCNKYPNHTNDISINSRNKDVVQAIIDEDQTAREFVEKIGVVYSSLE